MAEQRLWPHFAYRVLGLSIDAPIWDLAVRATNVIGIRDVRSQGLIGRDPRYLVPRNSAGIGRFRLQTPTAA